MDNEYKGVINIFGKFENLKDISFESLGGIKVADLREIARDLQIPDADTTGKVQLRELILENVKRLLPEGEFKEKPKKRPYNRKKSTEESDAEADNDDQLEISLSRDDSALEREIDFSGEGSYTGTFTAEGSSAAGPSSAEGASAEEPSPAEDSAAEEPAYEKQTHSREDNSGVSAVTEERPTVEGILELTDQGFGFLRFHNFLTSDKDIYVSPTQIRRFNLKTGDRIVGISRKANAEGGGRFGALLYVNTVNGDDPGVARTRPNFESLTPIFPNERIRLETTRANIATRLIDLIAPIGKGQRGLIVAPPKTGKTVLLKNIASSIEANYPDINVIVLLIDERPEEVTDMKRSIKGEVIYSTFDEQAEHHVKVAEMVMAYAMRMAEHKRDVIILLDSITRLARAYNMVVPSSGKTLSGGIDPGALHRPKRFFGTARNLEEGGSITILATALIETGSRMDDVIFEEFKGTGNMELHLDRKLSEMRVFPAINLSKSGTRREDLLMSPEEYEAMIKIRRAMSNTDVQEVTETIIDQIITTRKNQDFIEIIRKTKIIG